LDKEVLIGMVLSIAIFLFVYALTGINGIFNILLLFLISLLSKVLWNFKVNSSKVFYSFKLPLNIFFNFFLILLLLKWWSVKSYVKKLKEINPT